MTQISSYYAKVAISVDNSQLKKVDMFLRQVERRLSDFQKRMSAKNGAFNINFKLNTSRLEFDVQKAFNDVGKRIRFPIEKFIVHKEGLRNQVSAAIKEAISAVNKNIVLNAKVNQPKTPSASSSPARSQSSVSRANFLHAGGAGGAIARYGMEALPLVGGVYGIATLNQANQEIQKNQLALQAVAGPNAASYENYLNDLGNKLGMTTRALQPSFTQYLANAEGTALEGTIRKDFESFTQYGAVMGLGPEEMKGSLKAITQMVSKQQIYAEELRGQLAERLPAAVKLMAEAASGGDTKKLIEMMGKGQLDPNKVLPEFFNVLRGRSESMLGKYFEGSVFAQGKMNKALEDMLKLFSKTGGEKAFADLFKTIADGANSASPVVRGLTGAFENLVSFIKAPVNLFKDLNEGLENLSKTTKIAEGDLTTLALVGTLLISKWGRVAAMFAGILLVLEDISFGVRGKDSYTKDFIDWTNSLSNVEKTALGLAAAFTAVAAAIIKINNASRDGGGLGDIGKGKDGKARGVGFLGSLLNSPAGQVVAGAALFSTLTGAPFADGIGGIKSFESRMLLPEEQRLALKNQPINGVFPMGYSPVDFADRVVAVGDKSSMYYNNPRQYDLDKAAGQAAANQPVNISFGDIKVELPPSADGSTVTADQAATFANMIQTKLQDAMSAYTRK